MRYWLYKCNRRPNAVGARGDWLADLFEAGGPVEWPGHAASLAPEVHRALDERMAVGDVVACHQTDDRSLVGFCRVAEVRGEPGGRSLVLDPIEQLAPPFPVHEARRGTVLERSPALIGRVTLRELTAEEMEALVALCGAPRRVLQGRPKRNGNRRPGRTNARRRGRPPR